MKRGGTIVKVFEDNRNRRTRRGKGGGWSGNGKMTKRVKTFMDKLRGGNAKVANTYSGEIKQKGMK